MKSIETFLMASLIALPLLGAVVVAMLPSGNKPLLRYFTLGALILVFTPLLLLALLPVGSLGFDLTAANMQKVVQLPWIPSFDIQFAIGIDGISFPLLLLTGLVSLLAFGASWSIDRYVKPYCVLFLLLVAGMMGTFLAFDFFLFYIFWEVMLLPMYFLIGVWGGPRKEYAALKFFLFTLVGSVLMLVALLMLYFNSDLRQLNVSQLEQANVVAWDNSGERLEGDSLKQYLDAEPHPRHTFNILALQQLGQHTTQYDQKLAGGYSVSWWAFLLLFIGFAVKLPAVPIHTWLPDAHVEAPTPISMILAGILLKMGGYGIVRICYPICPDAGYDLAWLVTSLGAVSMVWGALAAMAQTDIKRMVAYSSVSHMGYVLLGLGVWSCVPGNLFDSTSWSMGVKGAMFQMIGHGISSAGMFFVVGMIYERVHHRDIDRFGGLYGKMPTYTALSMILFFAALGLPGLCGFIGEVLVVLSAWNYSGMLAIIAASVIILTAVYILRAIRKVYLGPEYVGPHGENLFDATLRERMIAIPLCLLAVLLGVYPNLVFRYSDATLDQQVEVLTQWTRTVKAPELLRDIESEKSSPDDDS